MSFDFANRSATKKDQKVISKLLYRAKYVHQHLDWRSITGWLGFQPYLLMEHKERIAAILACPPNPPGMAWIRLFASAGSLHPSVSWYPLFNKSLEILAFTPITTIASLGLHNWFTDVLYQSGFIHQYDIIVMEWKNQLPAFQQPAKDIFLRPMKPSDLTDVRKVDQLAFKPLWQIPIEALHCAYHQSSYASVAEENGQIIGYQLCTSTPVSAHLARLAVHPNMQKQQIGYFLLQDLLKKYHNQGMRHVTVNTQQNNQASISLYKKMGFKATGFSFPVLQYKIVDNSPTELTHLTN